MAPDKVCTGDAMSMVACQTLPAPRVPTGEFEHLPEPTDTPKLDKKSKSWRKS